ncbi:class I SAM-dependent methyltransferase [Citrifermentans bremense]|uniref:class I SAM-dependent methyltransferase n=1 Tax=Citrifermentans bremense TaxID=60035 RepID=UPI0004255E40|nr:class I SAM-dependent methyltransferase [Citrifermentans bremense]
MTTAADRPCAAELVQHNRELHDLLAPLYQARHREIYNPVEQRRIRELLQYLLELLQAAGTLQALDFGSGTGNLTRQLLGLGAAVLAADVSPGSLKELQAVTGSGDRLQTMRLNGRDLDGIDSDRFDLVATYSVLHHVPDYLRVVDEFARVAKSGGLIYIDHEVCPSYWARGSAYQQYLRELKESEQNHAVPSWKYLLGILRRKGGLRYLAAALRLRLKPVADDGDIHVTPEDHIDWPEIRRRLEFSCDIVAGEDYLVCRELQDPPPVWSRWRGRCVDMRYLVARKR